LLTGADKDGVRTESHVYAFFPSVLLYDCFVRETAEVFRSILAEECVPISLGKLVKNTVEGCEEHVHGTGRKGKVKSDVLNST